MGKRQIKQTISLMMAMLLCVTSFNFNLLASAAEDGDRIISFIGLEESVATQTLPLGATLEDVKLPDSLKAILETVEEVEVVKPIEKAKDIAEPEKSEGDEAEGAEVAPDEAIPEDEPKDEATEHPEEAPSNEAPVEEAPAEEPAEEVAPVEEPVLESAPETEPVADSEAAPEVSEVSAEPIDTGFLDILFPAMVVHAEEVEQLEETVTAEEPTTAVAGVIATSGPVVDIQYETIKEKKNVESEITIGNVKWKIQDGKVFDSSVESSYVFVPEFKTDYVIAAAVPSIKVNIVNTNKKAAFEQSIAIDGIRVVVKADTGVFPEGATLSVSKVSVAEEKAVESAVDEKRSDNKNVVGSYTFDIKVLDKDGNEIEPDTSKGQVKVSFTLEEVANDNLETDVYHIKGEVGALEAEELETKEVGATTVEAATDGFSYYTVEFTYNELQYVLDGDTSVALTEILAKVGLSGNIEAATSSNPELFTVEEQDGAWIVTAVKAFTSEEALKVTLDGVEYVIEVTDDVDWVEVDTAEAFQSAVDSGKNVKLTADITLSSEIAIGGTSDSRKQIIIDGNGKTVTSDGKLHRAICLNEYAVVAIKNLTISGFSNGLKAPSTYGTIGEGGAIMIYKGTLVLDGCTISSNKTTGGRGGGAIKNRSGILYAVNTTFEKNLSTGDLGGAIASDGNTYLYMCTFTENSTTGSESYGGALQFTSNNKYRIISCTFTNNSYGTATGRNDIAWTYGSPSDYTIAGCGTPTGDSKNLYLYPNTGLTTYEAGSAFLDYSDLSNIVFEYNTESGGYAAHIGGQVYTTFQSALDAWDSGETLKLLKDVSHAGPIKIENNADKTFDLNGFGVRDTSNYSTFKVESGKLTIIDSNPTKKHTCVIPSDGAGLATVDEEVIENDGAHSYFYGGYITGGNYVYGTNGGAIYVATGATLDMQGGNLVGNKAIGGGAIYSEGTAILDGVNVFGNEATNAGGAVQIDKGTFSIKNGNIYSNFAKNASGILFSGNSEKLVVENCKLYSNKNIGTDQNYEQSGAIYARGKEITLKDVEIENNIGTITGGVKIMGFQSGLGVPTLSLSGKCVIRNNGLTKADGYGDLYLVKNAKIVFPDGNLTSGSSIGIKMEAPGNFTTDDTISDSYFISNDNKYIVVKDSPGLKLEEYVALTDATPLIIKKGETELGTQAPAFGDTLVAECQATCLSYQWYRNNEEITGATDKSYQLTEADIGKTIFVKVTQTKDSSGNPYSDSAPTKSSEKTKSVTKVDGPTISYVQAQAALHYDYANELLTPNGDYEFATSESATEGEAELDISSIIDKEEASQRRIYVRVKETATQNPSAWRSVSLKARPTAPEGLEVVNVSPNGENDGKISGVTTAMEYSSDDGDTWTAITADPLTGLAVGEYMVRLASTESAFSSKVVTLKVEQDTAPPAPPSTDTGRIEITVKCDAGSVGKEVLISVEKGNDPVDSVNKTLESTQITATFDGLADGNYNIVVSVVDGEFTTTALLVIEKGNIAKTEVDVVNAEVSAVIDVQGEDTPKIAVDGLFDLLTQEDKDATAPGSNKEVEVKLNAEQVDDSKASGKTAEAIDKINKVLSPNQQLGKVFEFSLIKTIIDKATGVSQEENLGATNKKVLTLAIPLGDAVEKIKALFRVHNDGDAEPVEQLSEKQTGSVLKDNSFFVDLINQYLYLYESGFSTYALAFEAENPTPASGGSGSSSSSEAKTIPVYRLYNTATGEHLYTMDALEKANLIKSATGWTDEGIAWYASAAKVGKPVYRLLDMTGGTGHIYTTSELVKSEYVAKGWRDEGPCWYAPAASGRTVYVITDAKTGKVLYTTSQKEKDTLQAAGYTWQEAEFTAY